MTAAETGVYITLIAMMYERAEPLNFDRPKLARLCGIPAGSFRQVLSALVADGKILQTDAGLWSRRVEKELARVMERSAKAADSAKARWKSGVRENPTTTMHSGEQILKANTGKNPSDNNEPPMRSQCVRNANQSQSHIKSIALSGSPENDDISGPDEPVKKAPPETAKLPADWQPDAEMIAHAMSVGVPENRMEDEAHDFYEYWVKGKGSKTRRSDRGWRTSWKKWVDRSGPAYARAQQQIDRGGAGLPHGSGRSGARHVQGDPGDAAIRYLNRHGEE